MTTSSRQIGLEQATDAQAQVSNGSGYSIKGAIALIVGLFVFQLILYPLDMSIVLACQLELTRVIFLSSLAYFILNMAFGCQ